MTASFIQIVTAKPQIKTSAYTTPAVGILLAMAARAVERLDIPQECGNKSATPTFEKESHNALSECGVTFERRLDVISVVHGICNVRKAHYGRTDGVDSVVDGDNAFE